MRSSIVAVAAGAAFVASHLAAPAARAGGFATGRYTAEHGHPTTDNASSLYFNPGAMTRLPDGPRLLLDVSVALRSATFERAGHASDEPVPEGPPGDPARYADANIGEATLFNVLAAPTIGFSYKLDELVLGILLHAPFGGAAGYDRIAKYENEAAFPGAVDGPQRHYTISGSLRSLYISPAAAYQVTDALSLGVVFNVINSAVNTIRAKNVSNDNDLVTEGRAKLEVSGWQWSFGLGAMVEVTEKMFLGLSYQAQPNVSGGMVLDGEQETYFVGVGVQDRPAGPVQGPPPGSVNRGSEKASLHQTYPDIVRLGWSWRSSDTIELRVFGDYQRWSVFENQCVAPEGKDCTTNSDGSGARGTVVLQNARRNWNDTIGARAGVSYFLETTELFVGAGFDGNAAPDDLLEPSIPDSDKVSGALGAAFDLGESMRVGASYTHLQYLPRDNTGKSELSALEGGSGGPDAGGKYKSWVGVLNVNAGISF